MKERSVLNGHLGTDFAVSGNPPAVAAAPGVVTEAEGIWPDNPRAADANSGLREDENRLVIDHGDMLTILSSAGLFEGQLAEVSE